MRKTSMAAAAIVALAMFASCASTGGGGTTGVNSRVSDTLAPSIYYEEGYLVFLGVNTGLARNSLTADRIPLEIAVANKGLDLLTLTLEGISLREGTKEWPVAEAEERQGSTLRADFDRRLMPVSFPDAVALHLSAYRRLPGTFSNIPGDTTLTRDVEMQRYTYVLGQVWFENPGGDLKGRTFELWVRARELPDPVFTTFTF